MSILVLNSGSSSIKFSIYEATQATGAGAPGCLFDGELSGVGQSEAEVSFAPAGAGANKSKVKATDLGEALKIIFALVCKKGMPSIDGVGYRVVHPGASLRDHQRITAEVLSDLQQAADLAPLHDPEAVAVIEAAMQQWPDAQHFACFDTVFHQTMPEAASTYAIPVEYRERGIRRYGFHGLSCESVVKAMQADGTALPRRFVIAHLGSGCSVTAVVDGKSVDTTMGLTPTGGVVMGTRPGDLDPGVLFFMLREEKAVGTVETMLNHRCGLVGLTGLANDMQVIRKAAADGDAHAALALQVFTRSITKAMGGFCWLMGGVDAIVFSGGIGEHDALTREEVLKGLEGLGVRLDVARNAMHEDGLRSLHTSDSQVVVLVVPSQEDLMIATHVADMSVQGRYVE